MPSDDDDAQPAARRIPILLSPRQRWASGVFGIAAGGGGAMATFLTDNQAGATALLFAGGLGLLMSLTGRVPDRIGREGVVHERDDAPATRALTGLLNDEQIGQSTKAVVAEAVADEFERREDPQGGQTGRQTALQAQVTRILFEEKALSILRSIIPDDAIFRSPAFFPEAVDSNVQFDAAFLPAGSPSRAVVDRDLRC